MCCRRPPDPGQRPFAPGSRPNLREPAATLTRRPAPSDAFPGAALGIGTYQLRAEVPVQAEHRTITARTRDHRRHSVPSGLDPAQDRSHPFQFIHFRRPDIKISIPSHVARGREWGEFTVNGLTLFSSAIDDAVLVSSTKERGNPITNQPQIVAIGGIGFSHMARKRDDRRTGAVAVATTRTAPAAPACASACAARPT
jgi:hypothetical protein